MERVWCDIVCGGVALCVVVCCIGVVGIVSCGDIVINFLWEMNMKLLDKSIILLIKLQPEQQYRHLYKNCQLVKCFVLQIRLNLGYLPLNFHPHRDLILY